MPPTATHRDHPRAFPRRRMPSWSLLTMFTLTAGLLAFIGFHWGLHTSTVLELDVDDIVFLLIIAVAGGFVAARNRPMPAPAVDVRGAVDCVFTAVGAKHWAAVYRNHADRVLVIAQPGQTTDATVDQFTTGARGLRAHKSACAGCEHCHRPVLRAV